MYLLRVAFSVQLLHDELHQRLDGASAELVERLEDTLHPAVRDEDGGNKYCKMQSDEIDYKPKNKLAKFTG